MERRIANTISPRWTVYRIWPPNAVADNLLAGGKPWQAVSPGHRYVEPFETHDHAFEYATREAAKPDEACS